ncbi:MAG: transporter substrate-binding domain-containing protein [Betaproteobacteria bacterium]|nr:transporter substrate-binding domain-containing protein [Betaproteobacteria bacterium]MBU6510982.1 transporter substrate-binding domain-containing protein [Betaproteobacteria bacterium]MDE1954586.1 transporter substrate-binding domain-containing protein [Betaproteobacteria bacterium]MDE2154139.1 transporter substrate-binding domain-containing protein [Betaproteobacteria bacterium]MDE2480352.1 transporter substrate-binding domain-containing protein [Betaproteobacteria bacterium]
MNRRTFAFALLQPLFAAAVFAALATPASAADDLARIQHDKVLRVAIPTDFPPYGFVDSSMKPQGLDVAMAEYVAQQLHVKAELVPATSSNRIPYLQSGKVELVISTLGKTADREKVIDFSHAYSPFFLAVYGPASMGLHDPAELAGKSIAVTRGSVEDIQLSKVAPASTQIQRFGDNASTISAFVSGQVQLVATGVSVAATMIQNNPALHAQLKFVLKDSPNFIGMAKGQPALLARVNAIVDHAKADGELDKLSEHWLGRPAGNLPQ